MLHSKFHRQGRGNNQGLHWCSPLKAAHQIQTFAVTTQNGDLLPFISYVGQLGANNWNLLRQSCSRLIWSATLRHMISNLCLILAWFCPFCRHFPAYCLVCFKLLDWQFTGSALAVSASLGPKPVAKVAITCLILTKSVAAWWPYATKFLYSMWPYLANHGPTEYGI